MTQALSAVAAAEAARRKADPLAVYDIVSEALGAGANDPRLHYLQVLALAQLGARTRAERFYRSYRLSETADEDSLALGGRLAKDKARTATGEARKAYFQAASDAYFAAYQLRAGYFPAINAASMSWAAGDHARARALAETVLAHPDLRPPTCFYASASQAEALLLLGRTAEAKEAVKRALDQPDAGAGDRASAYRQLHWLHAEENIGGPEVEDLLARLRPPPVAAFCGHMFRADDAVERPLRAELDAALERTGANIGYGALACGGDIVIAEALLARGGELNVVLPFAREDFIRASVLPGGEEWVPRFDRCLEAAGSVTYATRMGYVGHDDQFNYGSALTMGLARLRALQLSAEAIQIALWDGRPAKGKAGTAHDVGAWRAAGGKTEIVRLTHIDRALDRGRRRSAYSGPARVMRAIIFTDFAGFSKLSEGALPEFWKEVMGRIGKLLRARGTAVCGRNTWGDALFAIIADPHTAAEIALDIGDSIRGATFSDPHLRAAEGMRIGIHFGPIYEDIDPVTAATAFYGTEVTLTARIEPKVPTGQIYVTQPFAAILATEAPGEFGLNYVGRVTLAKNYGELPMYQLERR